MEANSTIASKSNFISASFASNGDRSYLQTQYIVSLLKAGIEQGKVLTKEDIANCFVNFKFHDREILVKYDWDYFTGTGSRRVRKEYTKEQYRKKLYYPDAMQWFKSNLGSAILKGKILAIPVIEI